MWHSFSSVPSQPREGNVLPAKLSLKISNGEPMKQGFLSENEKSSIKNARNN